MKGKGGEGMMVDKELLRQRFGELCAVLQKAERWAAQSKDDPGLCVSIDDDEKRFRDEVGDRFEEVVAGFQGVYRVLPRQMGGVLGRVRNLLQ